MSIIQLDKNTIEQIAAGEVIESPFSIVKELVENSIDAESENITVEIKNGGKTYIRVTDDGLGIGEDDIELAFKRHATSKIKEFSDLYNLFTLGFRGEALASIITSADLTIISKTDNQDIGKKLSYKNSILDSKTSIATNRGTTIEVFDLFKNQPVRRKFLKSDISEANKINKLMYAIAISNPDLSIKYIRDDRVDFHTKKEGLENIIIKLLDENLKDNLIPIDFENDMYKVTGFISNSSYYRGNRSLQYLYVNNRYVYNNAITRCIETEYRSLIPATRFPAFFIFIETASRNIDVNIHPNKKEIKFVYEEPLTDLLSTNISKVLYQNMTIKSIKNKEEEKSEINFYDDYQNIINSYNKLIGEDADDNIYLSKEEKKVEKNFFEDFNTLDKTKEPLAEEINFVKETQKENIEEGISFKSEDSNLVDIIYKTSIFDRYSIYEKDEKIIILDHRRADEALKFSNFIKDFEANNLASQKLLEPKILKLDANSYNSYLKKEEMLESLGFDIENFGDQKIILRYVPLIFEDPEKLDYFYQLLDVDYKSDRESLYTKIFKIVSNNSFRKGHRINKDEADFLIKGLKKLDNPYKNYQGQNTLVIIDKNELEKYFDR